MSFRWNTLPFLVCGVALACGGTAGGARKGTGGGTAGDFGRGGASGIGGASMGGTFGSGGVSTGATTATATGGVSGTGGGAGAGGISGRGGIGSGGASGGAGAGGISGRGGIGSSGASGGTGGTSAPMPCPATAPESGSACAGPSGDSGQCTWGDSPRPECRTRGACNSGAWTIAQPPAYCAGLAAACPSDTPTQSAVCSDPSPQCLYNDGTLCHCTPCTGRALGDPAPFCLGQPLGTLVWNCDGAYAFQPPCPATVPNRGAACTVDSTIGCPVDSCGGLNVHCTGGVWAWTYPQVDCQRSWCGSKCSVCASPDTPIATPDGDRYIADLHVGDVVYTVEDDAIRPAPIARVSRTAVVDHHVVRVETADGRLLELSPGHPTADGRTFGDLRPGSHLDGTAVISVQLVPYQHPYTYDILPLSRSGTYFAAGLLIGTTLR